MFRTWVPDAIVVPARPVSPGAGAERPDPERERSKDLTNVSRDFN
jgi:hypothetical protein